jgi:hypothetical protein
MHRVGTNFKPKMRTAAFFSFLAVTAGIVSAQTDINIPLEPKCEGADIGQPFAPLWYLENGDLPVCEWMDCTKRTPAPLKPTSGYCGDRGCKELKQVNTKKPFDMKKWCV